MTIRKSKKVIYITHKGNSATFINMSARMAIKQFIYLYGVKR